MRSINFSSSGIDDAEWKQARMRAEYVRMEKVNEVWSKPRTPGDEGESDEGAARKVMGKMILARPKHDASHQASQHHRPWSTLR